MTETVGIRPSKNFFTELKITFPIMLKPYTITPHGQIQQVKARFIMPDDIITEKGNSFSTFRWNSEFDSSDRQRRTYMQPSFSLQLTGFFIKHILLPVMLNIAISHHSSGK